MYTLCVTRDNNQRTTCSNLIIISSKTPKSHTKPARKSFRMTQINTPGNGPRSQFESRLSRNGKITNFKCANTLFTGSEPFLVPFWNRFWKDQITMGLPPKGEGGERLPSPFPTSQVHVGHGRFLRHRLRIVLSENLWKSPPPSSNNSQTASPKRLMGKGKVGFSMFGFN